MGYGLMGHSNCCLAVVFGKHVLRAWGSDQWWGSGQKCTKLNREPRSTMVVRAFTSSGAQFGGSLTERCPH